MQKKFLLPILILPLCGFIFISSVCYKTCATSLAGQAFIRQFEGFYPTIYKDIGGRDTICFGHLIRKGERFNTPLSPAKCARIFKSDLKPFEKAVNQNTKRPLEPGQFDSSVSLLFNTGTKDKANFFKRVNHEADPEFTLFDKVNGKPVKGLYIRRKAEAALYGD